MQLSKATLQLYERYVEYWERSELEPQQFIDTLNSNAQKHIAESALIWYFRTARGVTLNLIRTPLISKPVEAFTDEQLLQVMQLARGLPSGERLELTLQVLYGTGARLAELIGIELEDVTPTHIVLRQTKRKPGGAQVQRAVPMSPMVRLATEQLQKLPPGKTNNLIGMARKTLEQRLSELSRYVPYRVHAHKFRSTYATHMLLRGVDIVTVQKLLGHTNIQTTLRYLAITDERLQEAVSKLELGGR